VLIVATLETPLGALEVAYDELGVHRSAFVMDSMSKDVQPLEGKHIRDELAHYFNAPGHEFQLQLKPCGTPYQQRVWAALCAIPAGETRTYGELATQLRSSPRAVGQACKRNPLVLFIPCHRVVGKNSLGGYMGRVDALVHKQALLQHERK
jgi:methylated-DNA-[protein]-cysteine S-methyltransferase